MKAYIQNAKQIQALKNAGRVTIENQEILRKRLQWARNEIKKTYDFGMLRPGVVQDRALKTVKQMEEMIQ